MDASLLSGRHSNLTDTRQSMKVFTIIMIPAVLFRINGLLGIHVYSFSQIKHYLSELWAVARNKVDFCLGLD